MRALLGVIVVILLLAAGAFMLGLWSPTGARSSGATVGTSGTINTERARERGAEIGEKTAEAAQKVQQTAHEAALTTKIKAKMALDDQVRARSIDVTTHGSVVTVSGTVRSAAERERALALARETDGVSQVIDHLQVGQ